MVVVRILRKFRGILSHHQKFRILEIAILMLIGAVIETLSVGIIVPFMDAVVNIDTIMEKPYIKKICGVLDLHHGYTFLFVAASSLGILYIVKNVYLILEYNVHYGFIYNNMLRMQDRVLDEMIHKPYDFFLGVDSGEVIRLINTDIYQSFLMLEEVLNFFTELMVSVMLIITIFIVAPHVTLAIATVLLVIMGIIYYIVKPAVKKAGEDASKAIAGMNKWLLQSIEGIKEIKVASVESFFQEHYTADGRIFVRTQKKSITLGTIPKFLIEAVCMASLFFIIAVLIITGSRFDDIMPIMSAVAMAAIRLLPSVNRLSVALTGMTYKEPMLDNLIASLADNATDFEVKMVEKQSVMDRPLEKRFDNKIEFREISFQYPGADKFILNGATMTIKKGESVGIVGESGAGKSTAIDLLLGLLRPQKGQIIVDGLDIFENIRQWNSQIGYIPQMIFILDGTIRENIVFGRNYYESDERVWMALEDAALDEFVKGLPEGLDTRIGERGIRLSGGQRQRIGIARALYTDPQVLVFDEATSALDNETEAAIMESINGLKGSKTMVIIAHRLTTIENCDQVYRVDNGKIVQC